MVILPHGGAQSLRSLCWLAREHDDAHVEFPHQHQARRHRRCRRRHEHHLEPAAHPRLSLSRQSGSAAQPQSAGLSGRLAICRRGPYLFIMLPLSVLDLSPVASGSSGAAALTNSLDLARLADELGYTRYWLAEHHNLASIASSAPEIMIGQIAAVTNRVRVGSGGVMLPNHAPLMVAER